MRELLAPAAALLALAGPVALTSSLRGDHNAQGVDIWGGQAAESQNSAGYEGLGVDDLEKIRIQAKRRKVDYRVAKSVNDGIGANKDPQATGFSYRISGQGCH